MSDLEERLRTALRAEADRRPVDLPAVERRVQARLSERSRPRRSRLARTGVPLLTAAAAAAAVAGTVAVVDRLRPDDPVATRPAQGDVDDRFTCPSRGRTVFDVENTDDSFLPELTPDLRPAGEAAALPRYEVEQLGDQVRVRFGDTEGTLASVVVFRRSGAGYEPVSVVKCTNGPGPAGPEADPDHPPRGSGGAGQLTARDFRRGAVKLFDTVTYDVNGLAVLRSVWAEPDGLRLSLVAGESGSMVIGGVRPRDARPSDATAFLYDPDTIVGQRTGYRLVVSYDQDNSLEGVSWRSKGGQSSAVRPVTGGWPGQLFAMVVPRDDFAGVTLRRVDGTEFVPAAEIKD